MNLSCSAAYALDLAKQPDGYLCPDDDVIGELRAAGIVTTKSAGDGFVIARAVQIPLPPHQPALNWRWYRRRQETGERAAAC